jgi:hypothetical protein
MLQACNVQPHGFSWPQRATSVVLAHRRPRCPAARRVAQAGRHTHARMHALPLPLLGLDRTGRWRGALLPPRESVTRERVAVHACTHWQVAVAVRDEWRSAGSGGHALWPGARGSGTCTAAAQPLFAPWPGTAGPTPRPRPRASEVDRRRDSGSVRAQSSIYIYNKSKSHRSSLPPLSNCGGPSFRA